MICVKPDAHSSKHHYTHTITHYHTHCTRAITKSTAQAINYPLPPPNNHTHAPKHTGHPVSAYGERGAVGKTAVGLDRVGVVAVLGTGGNQVAARVAGIKGGDYPPVTPRTCARSGESLPSMVGDGASIAHRLL